MLLLLFVLLIMFCEVQKENLPLGRTKEKASFSFSIAPGSI
jgi:hypothetical protein